ncbi:hypothetical protein GNAINCEL_00010 [Serratia phage KKP 3709]|nr:hypothetical protein GNAINCEL_00010 [Serratia phage KKP 3709]
MGNVEFVKTEKRYGGEAFRAVVYVPDQQDELVDHPRYFRGR